jgi:hypothetical protein
MFHDTTLSGSHMNDDTPKPVPPLTARKADGTRYTRFPDIEAEISDVWRRPPSVWVDRLEELKNETVVFLILKAGLQRDDYHRGLLLADLNERTIRISERAAEDFLDVAKEEIALQVQTRIFDLIWSGVTCAQTEFLEIAFAEQVRNLTTNEIKRHKKSLQGHCDSLDEWVDADSEKRGAFEAVELRKDVADSRPESEDLLILAEDETRREELYQRLRIGVKDPQDFQALYLFHGEDRSLAEIAAHFGVTKRQIRYRIGIAMHQARVALGIETEEKRKALRKQRHSRRPKRRIGYRRIRPHSEPPSLFI